MSSTVQELDTALARLAAALVPDERTTRVAPPVTSPPIIALPPNPGPTPRPMPAPMPPGTAKDVLKENALQARRHLYLSGMPVFTPERRRDAELQIPELIAFLKSLNSRPMLKRQIREMIAASRAQVDAAGYTDERLTALGDVLSTDIQGEGDRVLPLIGVCIAAGMAAYTIVKGWGR